MPPIRSLVSKRRAYIIAVILLLSKIIPTYSYCVLKELVYIIIIAPLSCQPSSYIKYTKLNMRLSCDVKSVSIAKYAFLMHSCILQSLQLPYLIYLRVSCNSYCGEARL